MSKPYKETKGTGMHVTTKHENTNEPVKYNIKFFCCHYRLTKKKGQFNCDFYPHHCYNVQYCPAYEEETDPKNRTKRDNYYKEYLKKRKHCSTKINTGKKRKQTSNTSKMNNTSIPKPKPQPKPQTQPVTLKDYLLTEKKKHSMIPRCPKDKVEKNKKLVNARVYNPEHKEGTIDNVSDTGTFHVVFRDGYNQDFAYNAFDTGYLILNKPAG